MDTEALPQVGDLLGDRVDDVGHLVADDELDVLRKGANTLAAISSPMNRPSLILTGPGRNSNICFVLGSCWWLGLCAFILRWVNKL